MKEIEKSDDHKLQILLIDIHTSLLKTEYTISNQLSSKSITLFVLLWFFNWMKMLINST